jgi:two-component system LytT family response regulator
MSSDKIKAVIIDDEELARQDLAILLKDFPAIEIIGEADHAVAAKSLIEKTDPDLIFLDVQMPDQSGFELLKNIHTDAGIIFVTAYDDYAIRAFEVNAQDYLLKPVNKERLALAIEHLTIDATQVSGEFRKFEYTDNMFIQMDNSHHLIKISSLIKVTAAGNYTEIFAQGGVSGLVSKTMYEWEARLPEKKFARIHRNAIVNLDFIERFEEWFNYSYKVFLKGVEQPLVMSRRYAIQMKEKLG